MMKLEGGFIQNLGRVYGIYTLGFLGFVILMAILEQAGVPARYIGYMFVGFTILIYALIGVLSRTMQSNEYYVAGRQVPAVFNGMATAAPKICQRAIRNDVRKSSFVNNFGYWVPARALM